MGAPSSSDEKQFGGRVQYKGGKFSQTEITVTEITVTEITVTVLVVASLSKEHAKACAVAVFFCFFVLFFLWGGELDSCSHTFTATVTCRL